MTIHHTSKRPKSGHQSRRRAAKGDAIAAVFRAEEAPWILGSAVPGLQGHEHMGSGDTVKHLSIEAWVFTIRISPNS
jgi:hypothetical protein